jgi:hypothetical protein
VADEVPFFAQRHAFSWVDIGRVADYWDVMQLAASLRLIAESDPLIAALETFPTHYQREIADALLWRIGVTPRGGDEDRALVRILERTMRATEVAIDRLFFDVFGGALPDSYGSEWDDLRAALAPYAPRKPRDHAFWQGSPCSMLIDEVEAIWSPIADADDWSHVHAKVAAIRAMGDALA